MSIVKVGNLPSEQIPVVLETANCQVNVAVINSVAVGVTNLHDDHFVVPTAQDSSYCYATSWTVTTSAINTYYTSSTQGSFTCPTAGQYYVQAKLRATTTVGISAVGFGITKGSINLIQYPTNSLYSTFLFASGLNYPSCMGIVRPSDELTDECRFLINLNVGDILYSSFCMTTDSATPVTTLAASASFKIALA